MFALCVWRTGTLPVINIEAVHKVIKTCLALGSKINEYSWFERKTIFIQIYPRVTKFLNSKILRRWSLLSNPDGTVGVAKKLKLKEFI